MALASYVATLGSNLGAEATNISLGVTDDPRTRMDTVVTNRTTLTGSTGAVTTAINASLADPTISGNPTALATVQAIQTAYGTVLTNVTNLSNAITAASAALPTGDVVVLVNPVTTITFNRLQRALQSLLQMIRGSSTLTP